MRSLSIVQVIFQRSKIAGFGHAQKTHHTVHVVTTGVERAIEIVKQQYSGDELFQLVSVTTECHGDCNEVIVDNQETTSAAGGDRGATTLPAVEDDTHGR